MLPTVARGVTAVMLACVLASLLSGCGSSAKPATSTQAAASRLLPLRLCFRQHGYSVAPDSATALHTAPRTFEFVAVWNLLNPNGVAVTVTISRSIDGAARAAAWTRQENAKLGKGVVTAPVVQYGRIDVLWTAAPERRDTSGIYPCVRTRA